MGARLGTGGLRWREAAVLVRLREGESQDVVSVSVMMALGRHQVW